MAAAAAAAAAAKVLRGGRSGFSSRLLSTAHKGQWRNPMISEGVNVKAPERMEQLCSKRSLHVEPKPEPKPKKEPVDPHPMAVMLLVASVCGAVYTLPANYRAVRGCFRVYK